MKQNQYLVNLDAIYQAIDDNQYELVEELQDADCPEVIEDGEFFEDAFERVYSAIDLLDDQLRMDASSVQFGIQEICQLSFMHLGAMRFPHPSCEWILDAFNDGCKYRHIMEDLNKNRAETTEGEFPKESYNEQLLYAHALFFGS